MSYTLATLRDCPNLQDYLSNYFLTNMQSMEGDLSPFLAFVTSAVNNRGLSQQVNPGNGKTRTVELKYFPRLLESEVSDDVTNPSCSSGSVYGDRYVQYTIDTSDNVGITRSFSATDLEQSCMDNSDYMIKVMAEMMDVVARKVATKTASELAANNIGKWANIVTGVDANDNLEIDFYDSSDNPKALSWQQVSRALRKTGYGRQVIGFSGDDIVNYYEATSVAGCCADFGIDLSAIWSRYGFAIQYDRRVASALGGNEFAAVTQPGALTLLTYVKAPWKDGMPYVQNGSNYIQVALADPIYSIPMDVLITDNCGTVTIQVVATTKLAGLPLDMFQGGDIYNEVTFVNTIEAV